MILKIDGIYEFNKLSMDVHLPDTKSILTSIQKFGVW